jgi:hypothetical protein
VWPLEFVLYFASAVTRISLSLPTVVPGGSVTKLNALENVNGEGLT